MDTHSGNRPDEREPWLQGDQRAPLPGQVRQPPAGSWLGDSDPLTGPMPPGDRGVRATLAEMQEANPPPVAPPRQSCRSDVPDGPPSSMFDAGTSALPTLGQPGPEAAPPPADEPSIPKSLAPMLHADQQHQRQQGHGRQHFDRQGHGQHFDQQRQAQQHYGQQHSGSAPPEGSAPRLGAGARALSAPGVLPGPNMAPQRGEARPARSSVLLPPVVLCTLLATAPSVLLLYHAGFDGDGVSSSGVIGATLMLIGLPMLAAGLYPMLGGNGTRGERAATSAEGSTGTPQALSRPPLVRLMVALVLLVAAALAAE